MSTSYFTPSRLWAITACLVLVNVVILYFYFNQPVVLSTGNDWDFRHADLRQLEAERAQELMLLNPEASTSATPSAQLQDN